MEFVKSFIVVACMCTAACRDMPPRGWPRTHGSGPAPTGLAPAPTGLAVPPRGWTRPHGAGPAPTGLAPTPDPTNSSADELSGNETTYPIISVVIQVTSATFKTRNHNYFGMCMHPCANMLGVKFSTIINYSQTSEQRTLWESFVLCREVVLFSEVQTVLEPYRQTNYLGP